MARRARGEQVRSWVERKWFSHRATLQPSERTNPAKLRLAAHPRRFRHAQAASDSRRRTPRAHHASLRAGQYARDLESARGRLALICLAGSNPVPYGVRLRFFATDCGNRHLPSNARLHILSCQSLQMLRLSDLFLTLLAPARLEICLPQLEMHLGTVRLERNGPLEVGYSLGGPVLLEVRLSNSVECIGQLRIDPERSAKHLERVAGIPVPKVHHPEILVAPRFIRANRHLLFELCRRLVQLLEVLVGHTEVIVSEG